MLENEHILDAFVGESIVVHLPVDQKLPEAFIRKALKDAELEFETIETNAEWLF